MPSYKTITVDAVSGKAFNTTKTLNHTVGTGADTLLIVCVAVRGDNITGVTFDGVAMTQAVDSSTYDANIFYLANPNVGTHQIAVTTSGTDSLIIAGLSVFNADIANPVDDTDSNVDSSSPFVATNTLTASVANGIAVQSVIHQHDSTGTFGAGQTSLVNSASTDGGAASYKTYASTGNVTMTYTAGDLVSQSVMLVKPVMIKAGSQFIMVG
jgi:hypothetical protein